VDDKHHYTREKLIDQIKGVAKTLDKKTVSRTEFIRESGIREYHVLKHFDGWNDFVRAAGLEPDISNVKIEDEELLRDWAEVVRKHQRIPTRNQYKREGKYSTSVLENHFGQWSAVPEKFRNLFLRRSEYADVLALLPNAPSDMTTIATETGVLPDASAGRRVASERHHPKLGHRLTYGNPLDFRGLRHEPVNEQGVVFLFGMVARELGYLIEAIQEGFPDCEAKRKIAPGKWEKVKIEFEYKSHTFHDHGHSVEGCDIIVCWEHNWPESPIEVLELRSAIEKLKK
jgi:hypothetical protein